MNCLLVMRVLAALLTAERTDELRDGSLATVNLLEESREPELLLLAEEDLFALELLLLADGLGEAILLATSIALELLLLEEEDLLEESRGLELLLLAAEDLLALELLFELELFDLDLTLELLFWVLEDLFVFFAMLHTFNNSFRPAALPDAQGKPAQKA
jgi:hypothetical protein